MALILNPTYSTNNSFAAYTSMIIDDSTGVYNVSTNPGGYGNPNPDRADLGLVLLVEKKGYGNIADTEITYNNTGNTYISVATWTVTIAVDGWFKSTVLGIPIWSAGSYATNQAVSHNDVIYTADTTTSNTPGTSEWTAATQATLILIRDNISTYSPTSTVYEGVLDKIITGLGDIGYGNAVASDLAKDRTAEYYDDVLDTNKIWAYLEGAKIAGSRSKYMEGERKVLIYTDLIAGKELTFS